MQEELITLKTAELAKEKGYNIPTAKGYYQTGMSIQVLLWVDAEPVGTELAFASTQSLLQKWLRETHNIDVDILIERFKDGINYCVQAQKFDLNTGNPDLNFVINGSYSFNDNGEYPTYELALEKGLQEALKLIKI